MHKQVIEIEERIKLAPERFIVPLIHRNELVLSVEAASVGGEPIPYWQAISLPFKVFEIGDSWGARWDTTWFKFSGTVPFHWQGEQVMAVVNLSHEQLKNAGNEGTVWLDGKVLTAVDSRQRSFLLIESALGGENIEFYVEAAANPVVKKFLPGDDLLMPEYDGEPLYRLDSAKLVTHDEQAYQLWIDFTCAADAMFAITENKPRRDQLRRVLNEVCQELEYSNQYAIHPAREILKEVTEKRNGETTHQITAIGHVHLGIGQNVPIRESIRKSARIFATVLGLMERNPDFCFVCSQPVLYLWMRKYYPSIYTAIKAAIERRQWEVAGSMWVEADCTIPSGESLIRQILHGKNFFIDEFNIETKDLWQPSGNGFAANLPQILKKSGIDWFFTQKKATYDLRAFPYDSFYWQGLDGSEVFSHISPSVAHDCDLKADEILQAQQNFRDVDRASSSLSLFGSNGSGESGGDAAPSLDQIERARRYNDFEGLPKVEMGSLLDFFEHTLLDNRKPHVWVGEMNQWQKKGSFTSQAYLKWMNRRCEFLLRDAEMLQVILQQLGVKDLLERMPAVGKIPLWDVQGHITAKQGNVTSRALDRAWKLLLLNQSSPIISGASIHWVYEDAHADYENIESIALEVRNSAMQKLCDLIATNDLTNPMVIFNSLAHERREVIELESGDLTFVTVPPCGYTVQGSDAWMTLPEGLTAVTVEPTGDGFSIYNGLISVHIAHSGVITSLFDVENDRELVADFSVANVFQLHKDYPNSGSAADLDSFYDENTEHLSDHGYVTVVQETALRAVIHVSRAFGQSQIEQNIVINAGSRRIDFKTEVDWQERNRLLKVSFPMNIKSPRASYETQFGHVERATHHNTSKDTGEYEVPAQKWADLSESDYGVALLNDCKYGYDIKGNVMRLSLLKSATSPDPEADRGVHQFTYSIIPHRGSLQDGEVIEESYGLNAPLIVQKTSKHDGKLPREQSFFRVNRRGVIIEAVKLAERTEDTIIRVYEAYQSRGEVTIFSPLHSQSSASEMDLMENRIHDISAENGEVTLRIMSFEIKTIQFNR